MIEPRRGVQAQSTSNCRVDGHPPATRSSGSPQPPCTSIHARSKFKSLMSSSPSIKKRRPASCQSIPASGSESSCRRRRQSAAPASNPRLLPSESRGYLWRETVLRSARTNFQGLCYRRRLIGFIAGGEDRICLLNCRSEKEVASASRRKIYWTLAGDKERGLLLELRKVMEGFMI